MKWVTRYLCFVFFILKIIANNNNKNINKNKHLLQFSFATTSFFAFHVVHEDPVPVVVVVAREDNAIIIFFCRFY